MELVLDTVHACKPFEKTKDPCRFRVRLFQPAPLQGPVVVLATQSWKDNALFLSNFADVMAQDVWFRLVKPLLPPGALPESNFVWVYQRPAYGRFYEKENRSDFPEELTRIAFAWDGDVMLPRGSKWEENIDRKIIEEQIGQTIAFEPPRGH